MGAVTPKHSRELQASSAKLASLGSSALRVARHRARQKQAGLAHLSVTVPAEDVPLFRDMARAARARQDPGTGPPAMGEAEPRCLSPAALRLAQSWSVRSGLKLRLNKPGWTLANLLARNIAHEIVTNGWSVGHNVGTEAELLNRYRVGRSLLRQATRLLESQSIAVVQRGTAGGLVVTKPNLDPVAYSAGVYLQSRYYCVPDLVALRIVLQTYLVEKCAMRLNGAARSSLERVLAIEAGFDASISASDLQRFDVVVAEIAGDPAAGMFLDTLLRTWRFYSDHASRERRAAVARETPRAHAAIARAILAGDAGTAVKIQTEYLRKMGEGLRHPAKHSDRSPR